MDLVVVANYGGGYNSMTAVGANSSLINVILNIFVGVGVGVNVVMASAKGENDKEKCDHILHSSMWLALIFGIVLGVVGFFLAPVILQWMNTAPEVIDKASTYLRWYFLALPFLMIFNFGTAILRAFGDSMRPMIALFICGFLNIGLNLAFVIGAKMDVQGVAIATFISEALEAVMIVLFLIFNKKGYGSFSIKRFKIYKNETLEVLRVGIPAGLQNFFFSFANVFIQASANSFGADVMAGNSASGTIEGYAFVCSDSISAATTATIAQNYGAKHYKNIKKVCIYGLMVNFIICIIIGLITSLCSKQLLSIFINSNSGSVGNVETAIKEGQDRLILMSATYWLCGIMHTSAAILKGIKKPNITAVVTAITCTAFRIFYIYVIFNNIKDAGLLILYLSMPISWILADLTYAYIIPRQLKKLRKDIRFSREAVL